MGRNITKIVMMNVSEHRHWVGIELGLNPGTLRYFVAHTIYALSKLLFSCETLIILISQD